MGVTGTSIGPDTTSTKEGTYAWSCSAIFANSSFPSWTFGVFQNFISFCICFILSPKFSILMIKFCNNSALSSVVFCCFPIFSDNNSMRFDCNVRRYSNCSETCFCTSPTLATLAGLNALSCLVNSPKPATILPTVCLFLQSIAASPHNSILIASGPPCASLQPLFVYVALTSW